MAPVTMFRDRARELVDRFYDEPDGAVVGAIESALIAAHDEGVEKAARIAERFPDPRNGYPFCGANALRRTLDGIKLTPKSGGAP